MKIFKKTKQVTEIKPTDSVSDFDENSNNQHRDPLYTIFEKHLYEFTNVKTGHSENESQDEFLEGVVKEYLNYLHQNKVIVPYKWYHMIIEELREQTRQMLIKKMYGCTSISEYLKSQKNISSLKKTAKKKHSKLF